MLSIELVLNRLCFYNTQTNIQCMNSWKTDILSFCLGRTNKTNSCDTVMHNYYYYALAFLENIQKASKKKMKKREKNLT